MIGKINNSWKHAKVKKLSEEAYQSIRIKSGLADAEKNLHKILKIDPDNTDAHIVLARYYSEHSQGKKKATRHYFAAAQLCYKKENLRSQSGEIFLEYLARYREPQELSLHLKYANALSNVGNYYGASRILEPLLNTNDISGIIGEKLFMNFINLSLKADLKEQAQNAFEKFKVNYPDSSQLKRAESLISSYKPKTKTRARVEKATVGPNRWLGLKEGIKETMSDWLFWFLILCGISLWLLLGAISKFILDYYSEFILLSIMISLVLTIAVRKISLFWGSIYERRCTNEKDVLRDYNISSFMDKARASERNENYDEAIEYLKAVIEEDRKGEYHLEVRHKLAWLYHKKVNQPQKAMREYQAIFKISPKDHPFRRDAYEGIKKLSQSKGSLNLVES